MIYCLEWLVYLIFGYSIPIQQHQLQWYSIQGCRSSLPKKTQFIIIHSKWILLVYAFTSNVGMSNAKLSLNTGPGYASWRVSSSWQSSGRWKVDRSLRTGQQDRWRPCAVDYVPSGAPQLGVMQPVASTVMSIVHHVLVLESAYELFKKTKNYRLNEIYIYLETARLYFLA